MGKYDPLRHHLGAQTAGSGALTMAFGDVEAVLGASLPRSARVHRPWWSNGSHVQARAWQAAGWEVATVDLVAESVTFTPRSSGESERLREPIGPVYPFNEPGGAITIHEGDIAIAVAGHGPGRLLVTMDGGLDVLWETDIGVTLGNVTLRLERPDLGQVDVPAVVNHSRGRGRIVSGGVGPGADMARMIVHWVNLPGIYPSEPLGDEHHAWAGYWVAHGAGWTVTFTSRPDLSETLDKMKPSRRFAVTQAGELRRTDGSPFDKDAAEDALYGWQVALSVALGRWVAPALPVGFDSAGRRSYEQWAAWRCDDPYGYMSWWDTHNGNDLKKFVALFLAAWFDDKRRDLIWHLSHSLIAANHSSTTVEARIMLALATVDYLSWVKYVISGARTRTQHNKKFADEHLRELLVAASIPPDIPDELPALSHLATEIGKTPPDGPMVLMHLRNLLVHPKDAGEPYRIQNLISDAWQLVMQYIELLFLHELGYRGQYGPRYPSNRWAHDRRPVPWNDHPATA